MILSLKSFIQTRLNGLCRNVKQRLRRWTKPDSQSLALNAVLDLSRSKSELVLENALLRQRLIVLQRQVKRPALTRASTSVSPAPQPEYSTTGERSSPTLFSAACITITAGEQAVSAHWLALPECQPMAGFLPATTPVCPRCEVQ